MTLPSFRQDSEDNIVVDNTYPEVHSLRLLPSASNPTECSKNADYNEVSKKMKISVEIFLNSRNSDQFLYSTKEHSTLDQKKAKLGNFPEVAQNVSGIYDITHFLQVKTVYFKIQRRLKNVKIVKHF